MADQPNMFQDEVPAQVTPTQEAAPQNTSVPADDQLANLLTGIKNENGQPKYDSVPKALEGLAHAQAYIPQLKAELSQRDQEIARLREELNKRESVEDVVSRLTATQRENESQGTPPATSGLNEEAVLQLVQKALGQQKAYDQAAQNQAQVQQALTSKFGEKAHEAVKAKASELGISPQKLGQLASESPAMVLALFNTSAQPTVKPTTGSQHIPATYMPEQPKLERPAKSLLSGATSKEQTEFMRKVKADVYAKLGVQP